MWEKWCMVIIIKKNLPSAAINKRMYIHINIYSIWEIYVSKSHNIFTNTQIIRIFQ